MDSDGTNQKRLTNDTNNYKYPIFSPNGDQIIFYSTAWDKSDDIFKINTDGTNLINLTQSQSADNHPVYSSDGEQILFTSTRDGNREIYLMDENGSNQTRLTNNEMVDHPPQFIQGLNNEQKIFNNYIYICFTNHI